MNNHVLKELLEEFRNGDLDAFTKIYTELKVPVYTIIYRILYNHMVTEDVIQEIFLKIYNTPPSKNIDNPRAWIFQMSRNLAIDYKRKIRNSEPLSYKIEAKNSSLENSISTRLDIESALKLLDAEDREIVTLRINGDLKFREIGEITKIPLGTVLWRYRKAIDKLRVLLSGGE